MNAHEARLLEGACYYCGEDAEAIEHVTDMAKGGTDTPDNTVGACISCNSAKRHRSFAAFLREAGIIIENSYIDRIAFALRWAPRAHLLTRDPAD